MKDARVSIHAVIQPHAPGIRPRLTDGNIPHDGATPTDWNTTHETLMYRTLQKRKA